MRQPKPFFYQGQPQLGSAEALRFMCLSDGHLGQKDSMHPDHLETLEQALLREKERMAFCVYNGDLVHDCPERLPEVAELFRKQQVRLFATRGNHDHCPEEDWKRIFGHGLNHRFQEGKTGFILLDSSDEQGSYRCVDRAFLAESLEAYRSLSAVFVVTHLAQGGQSYHSISCPDFLPLLQRFPNVKAVLHGHDHDMNGQVYCAGIPHLWSGHIGGSWGLPETIYREVIVEPDGLLISCIRALRTGEILQGHVFRNRF
ncbi:metallophosphoesterase family protein [Nitritalea halalkaliphila]|nr:metallophosphoesterase [Nitritalea halalkaliphila]